MSEPGGFLGRWSRLKREGDRAAAGETAAAPPETVAVPETACPPDQLAPPAAEAPEAALPPLESLTRDSDLGPFLKAGVPAALRNAALRRMWLLDPAIRDHADVAVDYFWDWNTPGGVPGHGGPIAPDAADRLLRALGGEPEPDVRELEVLPQASPPAAAPPPAATAEAKPDSLPESAAGPAEGQARPLPRETQPRMPRHGGARPV